MPVKFVQQPSNHAYENVGVQKPTQQVQQQVQQPAAAQEKRGGWKTTAKVVGGLAVVGALTYVGYRYLRNDDSQDVLPDLSDIANVDVPGYID